MFFFYPADRLKGSGITAVYGLYDGEELVCRIESPDVFEYARGLAAEDYYAESGKLYSFDGYSLAAMKSDGGEICSPERCASLMLSRIDRSLTGAWALKIDGEIIGCCETAFEVSGCVSALLREETDYIESCIHKKGMIGVSINGEVSVEEVMVDKTSVMSGQELAEYLRSVKECDYRWLGEYDDAMNAASEAINERENINMDVPRYIEREDREDMLAAENDRPDTGHDRSIHSWAVCTRSAGDSLIRFTYTCRYPEMVYTPRETKYIGTDDRLVGYEQVMVEGSDRLALTEKTVVYSASEIVDGSVKDLYTVSPYIERVVISGTRKQGEAGDSYGKFMWPIFYEEDPVITSYYGSRRPQFDGGGYHLGIDIFVPIGTEVYASDGGVVSCAEYIGSYGNMIIIDHDGELQTAYAHLSEMYVNVGDKVYGGQLIGLSGDSGNVSAGHLHFEVRLKLHTIDPFKYLPDYWPSEDGEDGGDGDN